MTSDAEQVRYVPLHSEASMLELTMMSNPIEILDEVVTLPELAAA